MAGMSFVAGLNDNNKCSPTGVLHPFLVVCLELLELEMKLDKHSPLAINPLRANTIAQLNRHRFSALRLGRTSESGQSKLTLHWNLQPKAKRNQTRRFAS